MSIIVSPQFAAEPLYFRNGGLKPHKHWLLRNRGSRSWGLCSSEAKIEAPPIHPVFIGDLIALGMFCQRTFFYLL
ncbi:MAG: hypothetical protein L0287_36615, partial [Anaerolineae bacterium]|nr:hypothetical protein [Anaerolineae bacterium]